MLLVLGGSGVFRDRSHEPRTDGPEVAALVVAQPQARGHLLPILVSTERVLWVLSGHQ